MKFTQIFCLIGAVSAVKLTTQEATEIDTTDLDNGSLAQELVYDSIDMDQMLAEVDEAEDEGRYRPTEAQIQRIARMVLKRLDRNGDGKVTKADLWALVNESLKRIPPKYRAQYEKHIKVQIDRMWKRFDTNGDGVFSHEEAVAFVRRMIR